LSVTFKVPSNTAALAVPALKVKSTVNASKSLLLLTSNSVALAPVRVTAVKSEFPSISILPATSAAIVTSVKFPFEEMVTAETNPSISTVSRLERLESVTEGPTEVVTSASLAPVISRVSRSVVLESVKVTTSFAEKDSTPFLMVIAPSNPLITAVLTSCNVILPSSIFSKVTAAGPVISRVISDWSPEA